MAAWSYSALTMFEQCPKKFAALRVFKTFKETENEYMLYGQTVHKALENHVRYGAELPDHLKHMLPTLEKIKKCGAVKAEERYALDRSHRLTEYFDKPNTPKDRTVWLRIVIDLQVMVRDKPIAMLIDYKTGKVKEDLDQLELFAAVMFDMYEELKQVRTGYWWVTQNQIAPKHFERNEAPIIWQKFAARVQRFEDAHKNNEWPAKPSGLCRQYCPVRDCEFYGKGNR